MNIKLLKIEYSASCGTYNNTATLTADNAPGLTASASTTVNCGNITLAKTTTTPVVNAGDDINYTVTVSNTRNLSAPRAPAS